MLSRDSDGEIRALQQKTVHSRRKVIASVEQNGRVKIRTLHNLHHHRVQQQQTRK